jgi:hypothetical protein
MAEAQYKNREIDEKLSEIRSLILEVRAQTIKTNGRVSSLENWKSYTIGFCACISVIIIPVVLMLIKLSL